MFNKENQQVKKLKKYLAQANSYQQWSEIAQSLDDLEKNELWKSDPYSDIYNHDMLTERLHALRNYRLAGDVEELSRALREGLHHDLGNMGDPRLYEACYLGTKHLIDDYVSEVCECLNYVCDTPSSDMHSAQKIDFFKAILLSFGRPALLMSGGASLGTFHLGVVKALWERDLLPQVITGSSAGSIIAAVLGTHTDEELPEFFDPERLSLKPWKWAGLVSGLTGRGFMDQEQLKESISDYIGDYTMQEAFERTGRSINVTVSPVQHHQKARLLSGYTSPYLLVRSAVLASCAVPSVFPAVKLLKKDKDGNTAAYMSKLRWVDGSVVSDLPIERLMHLYDVNFTIVSQTNPHVVPFLKLGEKIHTKSSLANIPIDVLKSELQFHGQAVFDYLRKNTDSQLVKQISGQLHSVLSQSYRGDITVAPNYGLKHYAKLLSNPSPEFIAELMLQGERATWPKLSMINTHAKISNTLESCISTLKTSVRNHRAKLSVIA